MTETPLRYWLLRHHDGLILTAQSGGHDFPREAYGFAVKGDVLEIGTWQGVPCFAADVDNLPDHPGILPVRLREIAGLMGMEAFALAGRAVQLLDWQRHHRFCGACATPTDRLPGEFAMQCPQCGLLAYPRLSPAVMVLVRRGDELLLARSPRFPPGVFSALAGFVEPGETVEACARREVREEVGIEITNLQYFGSQPWPFPNSLMLAFVADYAAGEITPDGREIESAGWFSRTTMPTLPLSFSIAHDLIKAALQ